MQIAGVQPNVQGVAAAPASGYPTEVVPGAAPAPPKDAFVPGERPAHFLSDYKMVSDRPLELPEEPPPRLNRPVLFVAGYMGDPAQWQGMESWLARDDINKFGGVIDSRHPGQIDPQANVFALRFTEPWHSVEANAAELKAAVESICQATGATGVDLVVHSKGGLDARQYLMDPDEKLDHVLMLGTPNKGTYLANLELLFRERFGYPIHPPIDDPEVGRTLHQLTVDRTDRHGKPQNPTLHELNQQWDVQRDRAEFLTVTGNGIPTVTPFPGLTIFGDGVVARKSAVMPHIPAKHLWFRTHGGLVQSKSVMREMANFLMDRPLSPEADLFDSPEDKAKALEMGLLAQAAAEDAQEFLVAR